MVALAHHCEARDHVCEIHATPHSLSAAAVDFAEHGLLRGETVVVIAESSRLNDVERKLAPMLQVPVIRRTQLVLLDVHAVLSRAIHGEVLRPETFRRYLKAVLNGASRAGNGQVRVYSEMPGPLWSAGKTSTAVELETYWHAACREQAFTLFCGYLLDPLDPRSYSAELEDICATHDAVSAGGDDGNLIDALDEACRARLGFSPSTVLPQSQAGARRWDTHLSGMHRTVMWLLQNVPSATPTILRQARREKLAG